MPAYDNTMYRDEPADMEDVNVHDVTLGADGGGGVAQSARSASTSAMGGGGGQKWYRKPKVMAAMACVVIVLVIVIIVVAVAGGNKNDQAQAVGISLPAPEVSATQLTTNKNSLLTTLMPLYKSRGMETGPLTNPDSFQGRAVEYVSGMSKFQMMQPAAQVEFYAIIVFYLSTFRQPHLLNANPGAWTSNEYWITKSELCLWEGIECDANEMVVGIVLPTNNMSGSLPMELSLLQNLAKLDFSSNLIYMDEDNHGLWSLLPKLQELVMDDNYFISETGIPVEFGDLTSIEKISLSFNLLQGSFSSAPFSTMTNLVHFEAESNYIGGTLPETMLTLPNLTYIYLRRNSLEFTLTSIVQTGFLPSIFALWLDGNTVKGKIPTTIGDYAGMASLSITDAQLTGPIPTEMGLLTDLQRLWLYGNKLTGPIPSQAAAAWTKLEVFEVYNNELIGVMPQPICNAIVASTYELKSLYADCNEVVCECCTTCN